MRGRIELEKILMKKGFPLSGYYFPRKQNRKPKNQRYHEKKQNWIIGSELNTVLSIEKSV
jgi:hypothetical protein